MAGPKSGQEKTTTIRKSCDFCNKRKKRCDGDGTNPCSLCIIKKQAACVYSRRRPQRPRKPRVNATSKGSGSESALSPAGVARRQASALLQTHGRALKRCRLSASMATGLVGMQENSFLSDFFDCMGFLPLTCQSTIREAMVKIMYSSVVPQQSAIAHEHEGEETLEALLLASGDGSPRRGNAGALVSAVDASTCMFWCAVALGGLLQGRPVSSVTGYIRLAKDALERCAGSDSADIARAWTVMAYLYGFCGDPTSFHDCQLRAAGLMRDAAAQESGGELSPEFVDLVRHADGVSMFYGNSANTADVEVYCNELGPHPQMSAVVCEIEMCKFVMQSYRRFGQAFFTDVYAQTVAIHAKKDEERERQGYEGHAHLLSDGTSVDGMSTDGTTTDGDAIALSGEQATDPPSAGGNMRRMMEEALPMYERLEGAVDRPGVRSSIGGLMINCTLVVLKASKKDVAGAVERISRCVEVLTRFPGMCRFPMGLHITHLLISVLAALDEGEMYELLRTAYNPMRPEGSASVPPLEDWEGITPHCEHIYCRSIERRIRSFRPETTPPITKEHHAEVGPAYSHAEAGPTYSCEPEITEMDQRASSPRVGGGKGGLGSAFAGARASVVQDPGSRELWPAPVNGYDDEIASAATTMEELDPIATADSYDLSAALAGGGLDGEWGVFGARSEAMSTTTATGAGAARGVARDTRGGVGGGGAGRERLARGWDSGLRDEGGDIDGGNVVDSVAEVAETYLLSGSDEESYREIEDTLAAEHWLDITDAMLGQTHPDPGLGVG